MNTVVEKDGITIQTDRAITANRPDIVIKNIWEKKCTLMDAAMPSDKNISIKVSETGQIQRPGNGNNPLVADEYTAYLEVEAKWKEQGESDQYLGGITDEIWRWGNKMEERRVTKAQPQNKKAYDNV